MNVPAIIVGSLPTLKGLVFSRSTQTDYPGQIKTSSNGTSNLAANSSRNTSKGPHIRLHDIKSGGGMRSTVHGGYESDVALRECECRNTRDSGGPY